MMDAARLAMLEDVRLLKLAQMYETAFERFVVDMAREYVRDPDLLGKLDRLAGAQDEDHRGRIARELARLGAEVRPEDRPAAQRAALLDIVEVERAAHDFYLRALEHARDPDVRDLFAALAKEEAKHAHLAEEALALAQRRAEPANERERFRVLEAPPMWEGTSDLAR